MEEQEAFSIKIFSEMLATKAGQGDLRSFLETNNCAIKDFKKAETLK